MEHLETIRTSTVLDKQNQNFTLEVKSELKDLRLFSEEALIWLMLEHYQFSARNCSFLSKAAEMTSVLDNKMVSEELRRNLNEENGHALMYKRAFKEMGIDVADRQAFSPTEEFFNHIEHIISQNPYATLGALYATETAAIFEHEVFFDIGCEVFMRRSLNWQSSKLKAFHDLHLNGVEQGHKDGLESFVNDEKTDEAEIRKGALDATQAMKTWWDKLLIRASHMSRE